METTPPPSDGAPSGAPSSAPSPDDAGRPNGGFNWRHLNPAARFDDLAASLTFLTCLPTRLIPGMEERPLTAQSTGVFPLVGMGIGLLAGITVVVGSWFALPALVLAILAVIVQTGLTGALHEDGLSDSADSLGVRGDRDEKLAVMRTSTPGVFGVSALILAFALRVAILTGLAALSPWGVLLVLTAAGAVSRAGMVATMYFVPPVRSDGLSARVGSPEEATLIQAGIFAVLATFILLNLFAAVLALVLAGLATAGIAMLSKRQLGGQTGDVLGAVQVASEVAFLLGVLMAAA